ncbi:hypothetical protein MKEN_01458400 [Mycena kentingensis (nom. inval.)]|nr:hypothetical protein MKEN_01458400 [Mycena kentingensis (nom. inval.)]
MSSSYSAQDREIRELLRRASAASDKSDPVRRTALLKLIDLTRSTNAGGKYLAAKHIPELLTGTGGDLELEEAAINAVYDLCEDQGSGVSVVVAENEDEDGMRRTRMRSFRVSVRMFSLSVRKAGYAAITQISRAAQKWVRRNTDVLLQLLQSDEADEVVVVKQALLEHLELDAPVTLSVLCDQIMPPPLDAPDAEEVQMRERLKALVFKFLEEDLVRAIVGKRSGAEGALVDALVAAIPSLPTADTEVVVKQLLVRLPSLSSHDTILHTLIAQARAALKPRPLTDSARFYMDLLSYAVVEKALGSPTDLLRFYIPHVGKMALHSLLPADQVCVIANMAEALAACQTRGTAQQNTAVLNQAVDASAMVFECIAAAPMDARILKASKILLLNCQRRKASGWVVPTHFRATLDALRAKLEQEREQDVLELIKSICAPPVVPNGRTPTANTNANATRAQVPAAPVPAPAAAAVPPPVSLIRSRPLAGPASSLIAPAKNNKPVESMSIKHSIAADSSPRPPKRARLRTEMEGGGGDGAPKPKPTLLSRMGDGEGAGVGAGSGPMTGTGMGAGRGRGRGGGAVDFNTRNADGVPRGGFSIKGAAKAEPQGQVPVRQVQQQPASLLDRLGGKPRW